jgi:hypothetical protein
MCTPEQLHVIDKAERELLEEYGTTGAGALRLMATVLGEIECLRYSPDGVLDAFALMMVQEIGQYQIWRGTGFKKAPVWLSRHKSGALGLGASSKKAAVERCERMNQRMYDEFWVMR